jgi:hypothetical protein
MTYPKDLVATFFGSTLARLLSALGCADVEDDVVPVGHGSSRARRRRTFATPVIESVERIENELALLVVDLVHGPART